MFDKKIYIDTLTAVTNKKQAAHELSLSDFMDFLIDLFDIKAFTGGTEEYAAHIRQCADREPEYTMLGLRWLSDVSDAMDHGKWLDVFGLLYEDMYLSRGKASSTGQFYTPECVCDLMSDITVEKDERKSGKVCDCAAGSGRLLLSHYMKVSATEHSAGRKFQYDATDSDPMACKQCALNMMVHGMSGKVICQNSLTLDTPKVIYHINEVRYPINSGYYSIRKEVPEKSE